MHTIYRTINFLKVKSRSDVEGTKKLYKNKKLKFSLFIYTNDATHSKMCLRQIVQMVSIGIEKEEAE